MYAAVALIIRHTSKSEEKSINKNNSQIRQAIMHNSCTAQLNCNSPQTSYGQLFINASILSDFNAIHSKCVVNFNVLTYVLQR